MSLCCVSLQIKTVNAATMFLKAFGGLMLIISGTFGAFFLVGTPSSVAIMYLEFCVKEDIVMHNEVVVCH
jgi:hypothetical protein